MDCTGREKLQTATRDRAVPRLNKNFPVPADVSCSEFIDCREEATHICRAVVMELYLTKYSAVSIQMKLTG